MTIDLSTLTLWDLFLWAVLIVAVLYVLRVLWSILSLAIPLVIAGIIFLFVADKASGGDAIDQAARKVADWVRSRTGL